MPLWFNLERGGTVDKQLYERKRFKPSDYTVFLLIAAIFLLLTFTSDTFLTYNNLYSLLYGVSIQFFAVIGFTFLLILGEIDLAVGSMYGLSGTMAGVLMVLGKWNFLPSVLLTLVLCTAFGAGVGLLVTKLRLNSMMVTLGTMSLLKGLTAVLFNMMTANIYGEAYRNFAKFRIMGINWTILAMVLIVLVFEVLLQKAPSFKQLYYVGHNEETAKLYGIKTNKLKVLSFAACALTAALGGIIATSRITHSDILTGSGLEFSLITACVVGGASLAGGRGGMLKSAAGMLFIALLTNGMIIYRIEPNLQQVVIGIILVIAVSIDVWINKYKYKPFKLLRR
jgi:ribose/xylose/arabinose/galactoside ABC-type transport system permease subunit